MENDALGGDWLTDRPAAIAPTLTELQVCRLLAGIQNGELPPRALFALFTPEVEWITKAGIYRGSDIFERLGRKVERLAYVCLVAESRSDAGEIYSRVYEFHVNAPERLLTRTHFTLRNGYVARIFTYSVWLDWRWPYPERVRSEVDRLRSLGIQFVDPRPPSSAPLEW